MSKSVYLLTGLPGTGKTSIIKQLVAEIKDMPGGFYTEDIREGGVRRGFRLITLEGESAILSHVDIKNPHRVSKYGVDVEALDKIGVTALQKAIEQSEVIVIDEIGKMELLSERFKEAALAAIYSGKKVLGTIMLASNPWTDALRARPEVKLVTVTKTNRDTVIAEVREWLSAKDGRD